MQLTTHCSNGSTTTILIDYCGVTLNHSIDAQIASIACICDLSVLQNTNSHLHGVDGASSCPEQAHGYQCSTFK